MHNDISVFVKELKQYRHTLAKQCVNTLKGQAISGDVESAKKGLESALKHKQTNKTRLNNAHRSARYMIRVYQDTEYITQLSLGMRR